MDQVSPCYFQAHEKLFALTPVIVCVLFSSAAEAYVSFSVSNTDQIKTAKVGARQHFVRVASNYKCDNLIQAGNIRSGKWSGWKNVSCTKNASINNVDLISSPKRAYLVVSGTVTSKDYSRNFNQVKLFWSRTGRK